MRREPTGKEEGTSIPTLPLLAVRGHLCFRCLSHSAKLSKCGGCKRAIYCGKSCQTLDWKFQHKNHCKILQVVNEAEAQEEAESRSCSEWKRLLVSIKHYISYHCLHQQLGVSTSLYLEVFSSLYICLCIPLWLSIERLIVHLYRKLRLLTEV
jgi:hypothetical protein